jgi:tetratricopeptide (TPR) repeat protein
MEVYPGDLSQIFNIVPPMVKLGKTDQAKTTLRQLKMMAPESADEVQKFVDEYLDGEDIDAASSEGGVNVLGLDKVVIVDSDDMAVKTLVSYLEELGVKNIETFEDGEAAFEHLSANPNADLIIAEWRIPKLTGPLFVQRLNKSEAGKVPVIISSSLIQSSDQALLKEMGVAGVLAKPSNRADFVQSILWVVQQEAMPTDQATMERKLRSAIKERNFEEIAEIKKRYMEDPNIPYGYKEMIEAEVAFSQGKFEKARDSAINALRYNGDSLLVLNLLGKTLMSLQQFDAALKFFEKAQNLSPQNLERLCQIAEVHSELGNDEEADSALEKAEKMDSGSQSIVETKAKDAMKKGDTDRAKALFSQLDSLENVVSYLNNQAVALARCDKFDQSFDHYSKAIASIPDEKEGLRAIVLYNLGLAYIRSGEMDKARDTLRDAGCHEGSRVYQKARILSKKVSKAIELNIEIKLNTSSATFSNTEVEEDIADSSLMDSDGAENPLAQDNIKSETEVLDQKTSVLEGVLTLNPNDLNLYLIYHAIDANNNLTDKMLATIPRFKKRSAIEREESGGADRLLASSGG